MSTKKKSVPLSTEQLQFIQHHGVPRSHVFDAAGRRRKDYLASFRESGCVVAVGVKPCDRAGHAMRGPGGHCVQCHPKTLAFRALHRRPGYVYVAYSEEALLCKVGVSNHLERRLMKLNSDVYGGAADWQLTWWTHFAEAGVAETDIHKQLWQWHVSGSYTRQDKEQACDELFRCTPDQALNAFTAVITGYAHK